MAELSLCDFLFTIQTMIVSQLCIYPIKSCQGIKLQTAKVTVKGLLWDREMMVVSQRGKFLTQRQFPQLAKVRVELSNDLLTIEEVDSVASQITLSVVDDSIQPLSFNPTFKGRKIEVEVWGDRTLAIDQGDRVAHWFHQVLKLDDTKQCRLVRQSPQHPRLTKQQYEQNSHNVVSFADSYPCLLTTTASLAELNRRIIDTYQSSDHLVTMDRFRSNIVVETELPFDEDRWKIVEIGSLKFNLVKPCSRCIITTINQQNSDRNKLREPLRTLGTFRQFGEQGVMFGENIAPETSGTIAVGDRLRVLQTR